MEKGQRDPSMTGDVHGRRTGHSPLRRCGFAVSLLALASAALVGVPTASAAAQPPLTEQSVPPDIAEGELDGGLAPADSLGDLPGEAVGEAADEVGVLDLLGPDGTYTLRDGDGETQLRLLDPADAAFADEAAFADLAASAATAYASGANDTASSETAIPSNWLVSDSGQLFLLVGGVNILFERQLSQPEISAILDRHGVAPGHVSAIGELPNAYLIRTVSDAASLRLADALSSESGVDSAVPNLYTPLSTSPAPKSSSWTSTTQRTHRRCTPYTEPYPDQLSACLWHLDAGTDYRFQGADPTMDINLGDVWDTTMGAGVTVAVVDHTWEATHEDIRDNVDTARSQILGGFTGENANASTPYHGTAVAGIVAARDNTVGGRGVAPRATLVNYNILDSYSSATHVTALTLNKATVAVYNLSYGPTDSYFPTTSSYLWRQAVEEGLREGFGGKGSSYVKAAGNGRGSPGSGWASLEEWNNHRGIIPVCALEADGEQASYSENGANLWVCAPGGGIYPEPRILAPIGKDGYTDTFNGTSAAAPVVSGVIALMRSVNADLTWRDVKVILANTAQKNHASHSGWTTGATKYGSDSEKYSFSYEYGFGAVDAEAAVEAASSWTLLPTEYIFQREAYEYAALPASGNEIELTHDFASTLSVFSSKMDFTEHVQVFVRGEIYDMRDYRWTLVSPSGTESLLAPEYTSCEAGTCGLRGTFRFGSSRHLGEDPSGTWKLKVRRYAPDVVGCNGVGNGTGVIQSSRCQKINSFNETITSWKISVSGHTSSTAEPVTLSVSPSTVTEGGEAEVSVTVGGTAPTQDLVVPLKITDGTTTAAGSPGADYAALASITVPAGASSASAKLSTAQDDVDEPDETFTIGFGSLPAGYKAAGSAVTVTIADDDPLPTVTLKSASAAVSEGDSSTITASLSKPSSQDVTLDVSAAAVAPAVSGDGALSALTRLTIAAGSTTSTGTVAFTASQNTVYELASAKAKKFEITATATGGNGVADPDAITITIQDDDDPPVVSITGGGDATEGDPAVFTLTATPAPTANLGVSVTVAAVGDYGATTGARTVTIPTSGTATLSVATVGDDVDEADGSVSVTVQSGTDYTPASTPSATVAVADDDDPPLGGYVVDAQVVTRVRALAAQTHHGVAHVNRWNRVLVAFGEHDGTGVTGGAMTKAQAQQMADQHSSPVWDEVVAELTALEAAPPPVIPVVSIASGGDVTEGAAAVFTVTAAPAPAADLDVTVTVTAGGDYGAAAGGRTVTVPASGAATLSVATTDDSVDEADGSVSAALGAGSGYTVSPSAGAATVAVADDDDPLPVVSVVASGGVTEGSAALFTVTASPPTAADLVVSVAVSAGGDFGVAAGTRAVTIPAGAGKPVSLACLLVGGPLCPGSTSLSVATVGDSTDEADGSVTVTLSTPTADAGYAVSSSAGAATVVVADDDDPPPGYIVDAQVVARVRVLAAQTRHGAVHVNRWNRVLVAFGEHDGTGVSGGAMDAAEAQQMADRHSSPVWDEVVAELTALEAAASPPPPPPEPEVSVVSGGDVTEGAAAVFTVTAAPAPAADLDVTVTVTAGGDYGAATGTKTVTVPASGSVTVTVATADDSVDEADGSVTVTLNAGSGYTVSATAGAATAAVSDNDDPPPPPPPPEPEVSVVSGGDVTEG
ncbi:MAG: S8 family serine peptidase, partial [Acidimicrobiaceae bacterium]|nr:S8 family serine peptidase [Acidimicrobiaceae bacterium]